MHSIATLTCILSALCFLDVALGAHAGFSVHFPWITREKATLLDERQDLLAFEPYCGTPLSTPYLVALNNASAGRIKSNAQEFSGRAATFASFSGMPGDLVSISYTPRRVPRKADDFTVKIIKDIPIPASGQLCFDQFQMPERPMPENGVFLLEARDPKSTYYEYFCADVVLVDIVETGAEHPAMCARNNETLIPMPDEYL
ncbi:hypothetical protein BDN72DRAFT_892502 [Pluteus cervinus]|uniref:Uncharacterized protein n=1 Tax=Pluteus cervinus TaxID=181527 RepID=A0ACD3BAR3_9AGAR|nr:hypothetical protein BDN72DRAFT_892502 [Pluteus cervinus]